MPTKKELERELEEAHGKIAEMDRDLGEAYDKISELMKEMDALEKNKKADSSDSKHHRYKEAYDKIMDIMEKESARNVHVMMVFEKIEKELLG